MTTEPQQINIFIFQIQAVRAAGFRPQTFPKIKHFRGQFSETTWTDSIKIYKSDFTIYKVKKPGLILHQ